jgi:hypothetical protein
MSSVKPLREIVRDSKREAKDFYEPLLKEYEKILEISEPYHCS